MQPVERAASSRVRGLLTCSGSKEAI